MWSRKFTIATVGCFAGLIIAGAAVLRYDMYMLILAGIACWTSAITAMLPENL